VARALVALSLASAALLGCDLDASARDYARRSCALRCAMAGTLCQQRCEQRQASTWSVWVVRVEPREPLTGPAEVTLETRDGQTGTLDQTRLLSNGSIGWPATAAELRLSRADDGRGVAVLGYVIDGGTGAVAEASEVAVGWLTPTAVEWVATMASPRSNLSVVATADGERFWVGGPAAFGVREVRRGAVLASSAVASTPRAVVGLSARGGRVFMATSTEVQSFSQVASGEPLTLEWQSPGLADVEVVDLEASVPGLDALYLARGAGQKGLAKYVRRGAAWQLQWEASAALGIDDPATCSRLAVRPTPPRATIFCVRGAGEAAVVQFEDDPGALDGGAPGPSLFAVAPPGSSFRGVAIVPEVP
jgi:hypothetical protein